MNTTILLYFAHVFPFRIASQKYCRFTLNLMKHKVKPHLKQLGIKKFSSRLKQSTSYFRGSVLLAYSARS